MKQLASPAQLKGHLCPHSGSFCIQFLHFTVGKTPVCYYQKSVGRVRLGHIPGQVKHPSLTITTITTITTILVTRD